MVVVIDEGKARHQLIVDIVEGARGAFPEGMNEAGRLAEARPQCALVRLQLILCVALIRRCKEIANAKYSSMLRSTNCYSGACDER